MKFLPLIWAGMWRRPGRAALTLVSMICAFVLFGVLQGFSAGLDKIITEAHADGLVVESQVSEIDPLPVSLAPRIAALPGVKDVAKVVLMSGPFRGPNDFMPALAVDPAGLQGLDVRLSITPAQWAALASHPSGALVPADFAKLHDLKVGDRIPMKPNFVQRRDGAPSWPVDVVAIYPDKPDDDFRAVFVNYDYVDQARASDVGTVHALDVRVDDPAHATQIAAAIDRLSQNSPHATRTFTTKQLRLASVAQIGQVGLAVRLIMGAVFFALLFSVGAVMIQSARERTGEIAVLKTLGFGDAALTALILAEALAFCLIAAAIGLALSRYLYPVMLKALSFNGVPSGPTLAVGLAFAIGLAVVTAAVPAWRAARLSIVDALAGR
jgi:putative ABC transport system permease protein